MITLPNGEQIKPMTLYPVVLRIDIKTSDDMRFCFNDDDIIYTGEYKEHEHGEYEVIFIKKGTKVSIQLDMFGKNIHLFPYNNKQDVLYQNAILGIHFDWII
jgi:hypothetical protein